MTDTQPTVTEEWIEQGARALCKGMGRDPDLLTLSPIARSEDEPDTPAWRHWAGESRLVLTAVAPLIAAAERERCARVVNRYRGEGLVDLRSIAAAIRTGSAP